MGSRRAIWLVVAALGLGLFGLVGAGVFYLYSSAGEERLRQVILQKINDQISGHLEIKQLHLHQWGELELQGIRLSDPTGVKVASVDSLQLNISLVRLLRSQVRINKLRIKDVHLEMIEEDRGWSFSQATKSRAQSEPSRSPSFSGVAWPVYCDKIEITGLQAHVQPKASPGENTKTINLGDGVVSGSWKYDEKSRAELSLTGHLSGIQKGPIALDLAVESNLRKQTVSLERSKLQFRQSLIALSGNWEEGEWKGKLEELRIARPDIAELVPSIAWKQDLVMAGSIQSHFSQASLQASLWLGKTDDISQESRLSLNAEIGFQPLQARSLIKLNQFDFSQWIEKVPTTKINGSLHALYEEKEKSAERTGKVTLDFTPSLIGKGRINELKGQIVLQNEIISPKISLGLPGGRIYLHGNAGAGQLDLKALLQAHNLEMLASKANQMALTDIVPTLKGTGFLNFRVNGKINSPKAEFNGKWKNLQVQDIIAQGLNLQGGVPDISNPLAFWSRLSVEKGKLNGKAFRNLGARVQANHKRLWLKVHSRGAARINVGLQGNLDNDLQGARINSFQVTTADSKWSLAQVAQIRFQNGFWTDHFSLKSGEQLLSVKGGVVGNKINLTTLAKKVNLARIPSIVVPRNWKLQGIVNLQGRIYGNISRPQGDASLSWVNLGMNNYRDLNGTMKIKKSASRVFAEGKIQQNMAQAIINLDLPWDWTNASSKTAVSGQLDLTRISLEQWKVALGNTHIPTGNVDAHLKLEGTLGQPRLNMHGNATAIEMEGLPKSKLHWSAEIANNTQAQVALNSGLAGQLRLHATGNRSLREWIFGSALKKDLLNIPMQVQLSAGNLSIEKLSKPFFPMKTSQIIGGLASIEANIKGTAGNPQGKISWLIKDGQWGDIQKIEGKGLLAVNPSNFELQVRLNECTGQPKPWVSAFASIQSSLDELIAGNFQNKAIEGKIEVGPISFASLPFLQNSAKGEVSAQVTMGGTLQSPWLQGNMRIPQLQSQGKNWGSLQAILNYQNRKGKASVSLGAKEIGQLQANTEIQADFGWNSFLKGIEWKKAPLSMQLQASNYDLGVLGALIPVMRQTSGQLSASVTISGTVGEPIPHGKISLTKGSFVVPEHGFYRDVNMELVVSDQHLDLKRLFVRAGAGWLEMNASGSRTNSKDLFNLTANLKMKRFPLVVSGQRLAILSGKTEKWTGQFDWQHGAMNVRLQELLAELPSTSSKTLQPLEQNPEITIVSKNDAKKEKKAKVLNARFIKKPKTKSAFEASIRIQAPRAITIKSNDARIELGADLQLDLGNKTVLVGNAELFPDISRGGTGQSRVDVMSRTFAIDSGKVTWFSGGEPDNPQLNIQAVYKEPREQVEVTVRVLGTGLKPRIELSSEPTLDETAIATLLATGRTELKRGSGQIAFGDNAASVVSAFASDRLRKTIANVMPLDIFRPDVLQVELDQNRKYQSVRVGKYVTDDLFVGYHNNNNNAKQENENANEVRVEYQLTPKVTLESQYGDANRGGVDMVLTHDY